MIVVDTAVWVDHVHDGDEELARLLDAGRVLAHPWVTGELALGSLRGRAEILRLLDELPQAQVATPVELPAFIGRGLQGARQATRSPRRVGIVMPRRPAPTRRRRPSAR